jgi:hypothetical protein
MEKINFTPMLRMILDVINPNDSERVSLSVMNRCCGAFHAYVEADPGGFRQNAKGKLFALGKDQGGIAGLAAGGLKNLLAQLSDDDDEMESGRGQDPDPNRDPGDPNPDPNPPPPVPDPVREVDIGSRQ